MNIGKHAGQPTSALITPDNWLHIFVLSKSVSYSFFLATRCTCVWGFPGEFREKFREAGNSS
jgi:hypothetical protein